MWLVLLAALFQVSLEVPDLGGTWKTVQAAARAAGYDLSDIKMDDVVVLTPGQRAPKQGRFIRPRSPSNLEPALIDLAVDEKFGGNSGIKLAIKSVNRLLHKQSEALDAMKKDNKISEEQWKDLRRRLFE